MNFWGFISASVLLTLMPGPDILCVVTQAVSRGRRAAFVFAAGLCSGLVVHVTAVSFGLAYLLVSFYLVFWVLKLAGAVYLFVLGIKTFMARKKGLLNPEMAVIPSGKLYRRGVLMNILNPKVLLFFLGFFPQFVDASAENPLFQMVFLGGVFIIQAFLIFSVVAVLADRFLYKWVRRPRVALWVNIAEALIYCGIGISILFA